MVQVLYKDDHIMQKLPGTRIKSAKPLCVGDRVKARYYNGKWYDAMIISLQQGK